MVGLCEEGYELLEFIQAALL